MSNDEIAGRLQVLEVFAMTTLALYMANSRNDPDYSKAFGLLDMMRGQVAELSTALPQGAQTAAKQYADHLTGLAKENLRNMRGEGGTTH